MPPRSVEAWLAALRGADPPLREALAVTRAGAGIVIAAAAHLIADARLDELAPALADAFAPLVGDVKRDPICRGKTAIARALHTLDHWDDRVFVAGLRIVQREPDDSAGELRGVCGLAHAHFARADALDVLAELLHDAEVVTRTAAAQGLGDAGRPDATALLRYKLLEGDASAEVLSACCESLLALARDASSDFLVRLLEAYDEVAQAAALALGGARVAGAYDPLRTWCEGCRPEPRQRVGYLALALLRSDAANSYLADIARTRSPADAVAAARALATFRDDPAIGQLLRTIVPDVAEPTARREIEKLLVDIHADRRPT